MRKLFKALFCLCFLVAAISCSKDNMAKNELKTSLRSCEHTLFYTDFYDYDSNYLKTVLTEDVGMLCNLTLRKLIDTVNSHPTWFKLCADSLYINFRYSFTDSVTYPVIFKH